MKWTIIVINILMAIWFVGALAGAGCENETTELNRSACEAGTGLGAMFLLVIWAALDVILGVVYLATRSGSKSSADPKTTRECPHCKEAMRRDASVCPHCQRDSKPWLFADGTWWSQSQSGDWHYMTKRGQWEKSESAPTPAG